MVNIVFWKKAWVWIKNYWYIPAVLVYTISIWLFFRKSNKNLTKMLQISKESYQKEISAINEAREKEAEEKEKILLAYQETLKKLEKEHNVKVEDLSSKKKKEIKNLVEENKENPDALAKVMKELFGV